MADEQKLVPWQLVHENERLRDEIALFRGLLARIGGGACGE